MLAVFTKCCARGSVCASASSSPSPSPSPSPPSSHRHLVPKGSSGDYKKKAHYPNLKSVHKTQNTKHHTFYSSSSSSPLTPRYLTSLFPPNSKSVSKSLSLPLTNYPTPEPAPSIAPPRLFARSFGGRRGGEGRCVKRRGVAAGRALGNSNVCPSYSGDAPIFLLLLSPTPSSAPPPPPRVTLRFSSKSSPQASPATSPTMPGSPAPPVTPSAGTFGSCCRL